MEVLDRWREVPSLCAAQGPQGFLGATVVESWMFAWEPKRGKSVLTEEGQPPGNNISTKTPVSLTGPVGALDS